MIPIRLLIPTFFFVLFSISINAQLSDGSISPDFTVEDINGQVHTLYDYLDEGKSVILDFGATWCVPCWNYHNAGVLEAIYEDFGPGGTDEVMVFMIEGDNSTSQECIFGPVNCSGGTTGDWTTGVQYPILNPPGAEANALANDFGISFWPTLYGVAPNGEIYLIGQESYSGWESMLINSFQLQQSFYEVNETGCSSAIDVTSLNGEGSLVYEWSNGETTEDLIDLSTGSYTLTITDENNFQVEIGPININSDNANSIVDSQTDNVNCAGEFTGYIFVEAEGGSGNFIYEWNNGATGAELFDVPTGDYWVTVTDEENGCTSESYFFIEEPDQLDVDFEILDAECGEEEGSVFIGAFGGTGSFEFQFDGFSTTFNDVVLPPGTYDITISDLNGCELYEVFEINETMGPTAVISSSGDIDCLNSSSLLSSDGSTTGSNISYTWYDAFENVLGNDSNILVSNGGDYILEIFDSETGCLSVDQISVEMNDATPISISSYSNGIDCNNTTATISGLGSSDTGVTYTWSTDDGIISTATDQLTATVTAGGTYTLEVIDPITSCSASSTIFVPVNGDLPTATITAPTSFCAGAVANICVDTEAGNNYSWIIDGVELESDQSCITVATSSDITATVDNPMTGCSSSVNTTTNLVSIPTPSISGENSFCMGASTIICANASPGEIVSWDNQAGQFLGSSDCITVTATGTYQAVVSNASGCEAIVQTQVTAIDLPSANISGDVTICEGSSSTICADASGQNYEWIINDAVLSTEQCITVSNPGSYQLNVINNQCINTNFASVILDQIPLLELTSVGILDCNTDNVILSASTNGTEVTWSDAAGNFLATGSSYSANLAGQYYASSTTSSGCENVLSIIVEQDDSALPTAEYTFEATSFIYTFHNQSQGDVSSYLWDFGDGTTSTEENPSHNFSTAGTFLVCMTASNECGSNSFCQNVIIQSELNVAINTTSVSCFGGDDGLIDIVINGGVEPYTIISNPDIGNDASLLGLSAGEYLITIMDSNGAIVDVEALITEPSAMATNAVIVNASAGTNNGSIAIDVSGGTPGYSIEWSTGSTAFQLDNLPAGIYSSNITDANGCLLVEDHEVKELSSTNQIDFIQSFISSPNPAVDEINIQLELNREARVTLQLMNNLGQVMYQSNINSNKPNHNIDVSNYANGIYFIQLKYQNQSMTKKIMILD